MCFYLLVVCFTNVRLADDSPWQCGEVQGISFTDVDRAFVSVDFHDFDEKWCIAHHRLKFVAMHYEDGSAASTTDLFP
jgi:hypothetical protein